jgi:hypothetical protein
MNHATFRLAAGAAVITLTMGACGNTGTSGTAAKAPAAAAGPSVTATRPVTNGVEKTSAPAVSHEAIGTLSLASSVRVQASRWATWLAAPSLLAGRAAWGLMPVAAGLKARFRLADLSRNLGGIVART